jgi:PAS domain S-box-containing protein
LNETDAVLDRARRPFFASSLWVPLLLVSLGSAGIGFEGYQVIQALRDSVSTSTRAQGEATAREITRFIDREHERLGAYVLEKQAEIRQILALEDPWPIVDGLQESLHRMFRGALAFSVTDALGRPLFEDFEGLVGPVCQASMRDYAQALVSGDDDIAIPPIHPVPGAYHFDLITPWTLDSGESGLFFVSMSPQRIAEMLAAAEQASGHRMLLVNRDEPSLIEVSASGARDALRGDFRLMPESLDDYHFAMELPGTHWRLVVVPDNAILGDAVREVLLWVGLLVFGFLLITGVLLVVIRREEQRNSSLFMRSLQASVARQRAILQSMVDAMVTIDARGRIHNVNNAVTKMFGYEPSELIGHNVNILMPGPFQGGHDGYLDSYLRTGESKILGKGREVVARRKDGSVFPVLLTLGESFEGEERMFVGILHDMTAYNEAQRKIVAQAVEIKRSHEELDRISEMASNSLQSPLRSIASLGAAIEARDGNQLERQEKEQLRSLSNQARDASHLVQGLVDYTRVGEDVEREEIDLDELLAAVRRDLDQRIRAAGATLRIEPLGKVMCDPKQAHQLFWNLLDNALKFADPARAPEIQVAVDHAAETTDMLTVVVADNGIGIPADAIDKVFDAFHRVDPRHPGSGVGLGLSFCRKIAESAGGGISVDSQAGQGTRFAVTLPKAQS